MKPGLFLGGQSVMAEGMTRPHAPVGDRGWGAVMFSFLLVKSLMRFF